MGKLTDVAIRAWIRSGERFEGRSDGDGLVLTWREKRTAPSWRLRYRFAGKPRVRQHQAVYATLGPLMGNEIHALQLQTYTPEKWAEVRQELGL